MSESKNNSAWQKIFDKYEVLKVIANRGIFKISSDEIREFREPRLMAKFDHKINLPKIFSDNDLAILPITRGDYLISHFDLYHKFEIDDKNICKMQLPEYIQSLDSNKIFSESIALNCALASGIISDFIEDTQVIPTIFGRMGAGNFNFYIKDLKNNFQHNIQVKNPQIEIDAAYEGINNFALFEAKLDISEDFLIRQIYYPYRMWKDRLNKNIRTIFLIYSNGIYHLYEYKFENPENYNSLIPVKQKNYSIEDTKITAEDIQKILNGIKFVVEPKNISFPQADKFERVINLCELLDNKTMKRDEVTQNYSFDSRQTNYYTDAARYLGLVEKKNLEFNISDLGKKILSYNFKTRQLAYCRCILSHKVFYEVLKKYFNSGEMPNKNEIMQIMAKSNLNNIKSNETFKRRSSTVKSWINWIISLINE